VFSDFENKTKNIGVDFRRALFSEQATEWLNLGVNDYLSRSISSELLKAVVYAKRRRGTVIEPNQIFEREIA
jgi:hypothetical protein